MIILGSVRPRLWFEEQMEKYVLASSMEHTRPVDACEVGDVKELPWQG
jgi:hypothetical protein